MTIAKSLLVSFADGETEPEGVLFIQTSYLQQFKNKAAGDKEKFTITVDDSFQYGQKKGGTGRWLIYHNKDNKPYQVSILSHISVEDT